MVTQTANMAVTEIWGGRIELNSKEIADRQIHESTYDLTTVLPAPVYF